MRAIVSILVLLVARSGSFAGNDCCSDAAKAVPLCKVLSNAEKYDGKQVTVRGFYRAVLHGSVLMSPDCGETYVNMRQAAGYRADKHASKVIRSATKKDEFQAVEVVVRGAFRSAQEGQCFGQNCLRYELEDRELLCAEVPKNTSGNAERHQ